MKLQLWSIGKGHDVQLEEAVNHFTKRIARYYPVEWVILPPPRNAGSLPEEELKKREAGTITQWLKGDDYLVALDERGKDLASEDLAQFIQSRSNESVKSLVFLIGGAFGIHSSVLQKSKFQWSLSRLTLPHQIVRLILSEQIYRACTILRNEKYHHR